MAVFSVNILIVSAFFVTACLLEKWLSRKLVGSDRRKPGNALSLPNQAQLK
jgi:hypothetical protein